MLRLEQQAFISDRISRRSFHYLLNKGHACTLVDIRKKQLTGYILLLFRNHATSARIYSLAVEKMWRGQDIAASLLQAAEREAQRRKLSSIRLEVRTDNAAAQKLYHAAGYRTDGMHQHFYADGSHALRLRKQLAIAIEV